MACSPEKMLELCSLKQYFLHCVRVLILIIVMAIEVSLKYCTNSFASLLHESIYSQNRRKMICQSFITLGI